MALPTTNLTITDIKTVLGATTNKVSDLCTHPNINMWSRRKPVQDNRTKVPFDEVGNGNNNDFGLTIPAYTGDDTKLTTYNRPTSMFRIGDFRGYNHDAHPPIIIQPQPSQLEKKEQTITAIRVIGDDNITLEDLGLRLGVQVYGGTKFYIGSASARNNGGSSVTIDLTGLTYPSISIKFCLTNYYKAWDLSGMTALYEIPRDTVFQSSNWVNVPLVDSNSGGSSGAPIESFDVEQYLIIDYGIIRKRIRVTIQTSSYTGDVYLRFLENSQIVHTEIINVTRSGFVQEFILYDNWTEESTTYTVMAWLGGSASGARDAETTFTTQEDIDIMI